MFDFMTKSTVQKQSPVWSLKADVSKMADWVGFTDEELKRLKGQSAAQKG